MIRKQLLAASLLLASPLVLAQGDADQGKNLFAANCGYCHSTEAGKNQMGPSLHGVYGRAGGQAPAFAYSAPFKSAKPQWDEASLDKWLTNPAAMVPGTMMMFPGLASAEDRQHLIAYLKTLK
ncbi:c-type cytochrome [Pseudomonas panipatensis]|uniref:Cytochrome c n=1 Tax=Pseudomonas panipatensis TaxID=428992 RepID=A0A1G8DQ50_9PSED|nr:c-type cytochrome [Pseudomonas panipatensis]SDH59823.1 cytochrome c [Pseudomonas panipatensis]SMP40233.1 cytochrome c [Pseudomonas panipatensis]